MNLNTPKTELPYKSSVPIDKLSVKEGVKLLIDDQKKGLKKLSLLIDDLTSIVEEIYEHLCKSTHGRIIYCGAGTSGRIGVQDAVELYPTFGWPTNRVDFLLAGGKDALTKSIENSEDNVISSKNIVNEKKVNEYDVVIGLAASGNTPFTCQVLKNSLLKRAFTLAISNNPNGQILKYAKSKLIIDSKAEVIAGSTRLKAGTLQKVCLNIISSMVMIKMGNVKNGLMINLIPNNKKLKNRKKQITELINNSNKNENLKKNL